MKLIIIYIAVIIQGIVLSKVLRLVGSKLKPIERVKKLFDSDRK